MYFPTSSARLLSSLPSLPHLPPEPVIALSPSPSKALFCTLTKSGISVWKARPAVILAFLSRTQISIAEHGENVAVHWSPDGTRLVVQTTGSFLVLVYVDYDRNLSSAPYQASLLHSTAQRHFQNGPGEGAPMFAVNLGFEGVIRVDGELLSVSPRKGCIMFSTKTPPTIQRIPWPDEAEEEDELSVRRNLTGHDTWFLNEEEMPWLKNSYVTISEVSFSRSAVVETWITSDGRAYFVQLVEFNAGRSQTFDISSNYVPDDTSPATVQILKWQGVCIHDVEAPRWVQKQKAVLNDEAEFSYIEPRKATNIAVNAKFSVIAIGTTSGAVELANFPTFEPATPQPQHLKLPNVYGGEITGKVYRLEWSSDGYALAVGWEHGWAVFSVGGRCLSSSFGLDRNGTNERFQDTFMFHALDLFWGQGNFELMILSPPSSNRNGPDAQLFAIPFAKSAFAEQQTPDNTRYAFLQLDDRLLVYRGADQPDMSVINPESDVWQNVKVPLEYLSTNWPIKYSAINVDGRLIAVAGRRGLLHFSTSSGRWKLFKDSAQEQAFSVRGGLLWFHHVLIAAVDVSRSFQIHLYSRDLELNDRNILHREILSSPVVTLSLVDNSLLVYTADNILAHYLIIPTNDTIELHLCGSISFSGVITSPNSVRGLSWMIPNGQKQLGDPTDDLAVATVLMMVGAKLALLRPRKSGDQEVKYDMQILSDRIEFCWIHLRGIGALENSLWGYDGKGIRVWLNALNLDRGTTGELMLEQDVQESVNIPLDFYPLSTLMDKGIIIGVEHEIAMRSALPLVLFKHTTSSHLFIHHILLAHVKLNEIQQAVAFASHYESLVYFAHALEMLLHIVVESDAELLSASSRSEQPSLLLPAVVDFLDHFDVCLDVVVGCARKTELSRWKMLFDVVGNPKPLFEKCLSENRLKTAASYLLVLHNLEQLDDNSEAIRLLNKALYAEDTQLCREVLRFLHSIDDSGLALREALTQTSLFTLDEELLPSNSNQAINQD